MVWGVGARQFLSAPFDVLLGACVGTDRHAVCSEASCDMESRTAAAQGTKGGGGAKGTTVPTLRAPVISRAPKHAHGERPTLMVLSGPQAGHLVAIEQAAVVIGRAPDAGLVALDPSVSSYHARVARTPEGGYCVEDLGSTNGTFVNGRRVASSALHTNDRLQLGPQFGLRFALTDAADESLHRRLYDCSTRDALTGVFNRRYFDARLVAEVARAFATNTDAAVLMADVDGLKQINDRFGHMAGDHALCMTAAQMLRAVRAEDCVARYGGDEFVIVAPGAHLAEAARLAERARRAVAGLRLTARGEGMLVTLSIGAASLSELSELRPAEASAAALLERADRRLYRAKASGRNRVFVSESSPAP
jgi:two-component system cell cycle response regulator